MDAKTNGALSAVSGVLGELRAMLATWRQVQVAHEQAANNPALDDKSKAEHVALSESLRDCADDLESFLDAPTPEARVIEAAKQVDALSIQTEAHVRLRVALARLAQTQRAKP